MLDPAEIASIPPRLARLRKRRNYGCSFGAQSHQFQLNPSLPEPEVAKFEARYRITLPSDYRQFLLTVGNGGAGPHYGIHKLGAADEDKPWDPEDWLIGDPAAPFPHTKKWNPVPFDPDKDEPDDDVLDAIEEEYWALKHVNGAIPICHAGCNLRYWLVVSGPEASHIWYDGRVDWHGLTPVPTGSAARTTFVEWYCEWLSQAEQKAGLGNVRGQ